MKTPTQISRIADHFSRNVFALICFAMLSMAFKQSATAATLTWTGGGGNGGWDTAANWSPSVTIGVNTNDVLQFAGTTGLINSNNVAGDTNAGIIFLPGAGAFTLNPVAGDTTLLGGNINNESTNLQTINQNIQLTAASRSILAYDGSNNIGDILFTGVISPNGSASNVTFEASSLPAAFQPGQGEGCDGGDVTLTAANTYNGITLIGTLDGGNGGVGSFPGSAINGTGFGTLTLNFAAAGAPANNILYNGVANPGLSELNSGSTLLIEGAPGANNTNNFGNMQFSIGLNTVDLVAGSGGTVTANFLLLTTSDANNNSRAGAVNFVLGPNATVTTTSANSATTEILNNSSWAGANYMLNGTDWACESNGVIVGCTNYQVDAVSTANANLDVQTSGNVLSAEVATIRFNQNASLVLSNTVAESLGNNAILMTPNCGANTNIITGPGSLAASVTRGLLIFNFDSNPDSELIIDCPIGSGGGAQTSFFGPGLTKLTQPNQTGSVGVFSIFGGARLLINQNACFGNPTANNGGYEQMDDGTLMVQTNMALDSNNGGGIDPRNFAIGTHGGAFDVSGTNTLLIDGVITNGTGGPLTKIDTGTLELTGVNAYNGPTFVQGGTLAIGAAPKGTGPIVVNDGATLEDLGSVSINPFSLILGNSTGCTNTFTAVNSLTTAPIAVGTLDASGTIVINVTGPASIGTYPLISYTNDVGTGGFVVGTLPAGVAGNIVTNAINSGTNAIALNVTFVPLSDVWVGNDNNNWDIATTANWLYNGSPSDYVDGNYVSFGDMADQFNVNVAANVAPTGINVSNTVNAYTFSGTNNIGGGGIMTKIGTNSLEMAVNYNASGGINVNAGTLLVGDGTSNGAVTASSIVDNSTVVFNRADTSGSFSSGMSGSGTVIVNAYTNGIFQLGGVNSYLGNTIVQSGTLIPVASSSIPGVVGGGILTVDQTGVLNVNGEAVTVNGLSGNGIVDNQAAPAVNFTVGANNTTSAFAGSLINTAGLLSLVKIGAGTLTLTGTNYFGGGLQFDAGAVNVASFSDYSDAPTPDAGPSALGLRSSSQEISAGVAANSIGLFFGGGTLQYTGSTPQETDRAIRLATGNSGAIAASGSNPNATLYFSFGDTLGMNFNLFYQGGATRNLILTGSNTGTNTFDIQITDQAANAVSIVKQGVGTWYMLGGAAIGPNSYSGVTTVSTGTLVISTTHNDSGGSPAGANGLGPFTVADSATLGVTDGGNSEPALMSTLTVGTSAGGSLEFLNIPGGQPMIRATSTVFHGTCTFVCPTNNLVAGTTYPLLAYGTLSGNYTLAPMPGPLYYELTNDSVNIDLVASATSFVPLTPTNIVFSVTNNQLTLSWPASYTGYTLQAQTNSVSAGIGTNWVNVAGSSSVDSVTNTINLTNGCVFYRLMYNP